MEIELKRIAYNPRLDENAFAANLFIAGEKAATVNNRNGSTQYFPVNERGMELVTEAEEFLKKLPAEKKIVEGQEKTIKQSLTTQIEKLFANHLESIEQQKFNKKVELLQKRNIVFGVPGKYQRTHLMATPIDVLALSPGGQALISEAISKKIKPVMLEMEQILNTNIPKNVLIETLGESVQETRQEQVIKETKAQKKNTGVKL
ncbi:hypothetical protein D3C71_89200 [compost metagenome]